MWLLGWTCDWAGADNFLITAFFRYDGGKPNDGVRLRPAELKDDVRRARSAPTRPTAKAAWEKAQDILATDLPTVPLVNSKPPAASKAYVKGFVGARRPQRAAQRRLAGQVALEPGITGTHDPRSRPRFRGNVAHPARVSATP